MITNEINQCLKRVKGFVGTFPCNEIPPPKSYPSHYVINTARLDAKERRPIVEGKHWVVLTLKTSGTCEYFDSFGVQPTQPDIVNFISEHCNKNLKYNTQMIQNPLSRACGVYCVDYILARAAGVSVREYLRRFTPDLLSNDELVVTRVLCQLSALPPHLRSKLKSLNG